MTEERYRPCTTGIHICGADENAYEVYTQANYPMPHNRARSLFADLREEFSSGEEGDFVVDLVIGDDIIDDFYIRRQMLDRLKAACVS